MAIRNQKAFTIVELLMTIVIIAVLAGIAISTYSGVREDARDTTRQGNAITISEALEKYYEKNGDYPSVASLSNQGPGNTGSAIAAKLSIPANSLIMPKMPSSATNAITSGSEPHDDYIVYIGESALDNEACQSDVNGTCDQFTLRYLEESGEIKVIESRRTLREIIAKPDLTVTAASTSSIDASWTAIDGATSYTLQRSLSSDMSSPTSSSHPSTSTTVTGLSASVTYYFKVQANLPSGTSEWSDVASVTTNGIAKPTGSLTIVASLSGTNAVGTAGGGSCAAGTTIERQIRYSSTSTATAGAWSSYTTGSPRTVAASQGWQYTFQQQARCTGSGGSSGWISSGTSSVVRPVGSIAAPTVTSSTSGNITTFTASVTSCPTGTTAKYQSRGVRDGNFTTTSWTVPTTNRSASWNTAAQGYEYIMEFQTRCETVYSTGSWSPTGSAAYIRVVAAPTAPINFIGTKVDAYRYNWQWDSPSCGLGASGRFQYDIYVYGVSGNPWWWVDWHYQGWLSNSGAYGAYWHAPDLFPSSPTISLTFERISSDGPIPSGGKTQARAKYMCINAATGRTSGWGPVGTSSLKTVN